jgi:hypothetical protein
MDIFGIRMISGLKIRMDVDNYILKIIFLLVASVASPKEPLCFSDLKNISNKL